MNEQQRYAAHRIGHTSVIAPPGSGKSHTLVERCAYLAKVYPGVRIINVTFTREAADEMQARICARGMSEEATIISSTFHSLFKARLVSLGKLRGRIIPAALRPHLLREVAWRAQREWSESGRQHVHASPPPSGVIDELTVAKAIEEGKRYGVKPEELEAWKRIPLAIYEAELSRRGFVDLADLVLVYLKGLDDGSILPFKADFLHVDEFQDTDFGQLRFAIVHAAKGVTTTIVADDDQSIYQFRGSLGFQGVHLFEQATGAERVVLRSNYRSRAEIVTTASRLIERNSAVRIAKTVVAERGSGGVVQTYSFANRGVEANAIAEQLAYEPRGEWAVLSRNNADLRTLQSQLMTLRVPYSAPGGNLFDSEFIRCWLHLVSLIGTCGPEQFLHALASLLGSVGVPADQTAGIHDSKDDGLRNAVDGVRVVLNHPLGQGDDEWTEQIATLTLATQSLLRCAGLLFELKQKRLERCERDIAFCDSLVGGLRGTPRERVAWVERAAQTSQEPAQDGRPVLLTMHASKGMEFKNVWVMRVSDGTIPSRDGGANVWEERRLLYVAMTRAKDCLIVSHSGLPSEFWKEVVPA